MWFLEAVQLARSYVDAPVVLLVVLLWRVEKVRLEVTAMRPTLRVLELGHAGDREAHSALPGELARVRVRR